MFIQLSAFAMGFIGSRSWAHWSSNDPLDLFRDSLAETKLCTMEVIHCILGKANPKRLNGVNRVVHQLASEQAESG